MTAQNLLTLNIPQKIASQFVHICNLLELHLIETDSNNLTAMINSINKPNMAMNIVVHYFKSPLASLAKLDSELIKNHLHIAICPKLTTELEVTFISSGFHSCIAEDESIVTKIQSIKQVQTAGISFSPKAMSRYILQKKRLPSLNNRTKILALSTKKEQQILYFIWDGHSNEEVAYKLGISINTVKMHVQNIYKKTNIKNRGQLFALAIE